MFIQISLKNVTTFDVFLFEISFLFYLKDHDDHIALYGRAKTYITLKQLDKALDDIEQVIILKPQWAKVRMIY